MWWSGLIDCFLLNYSSIPRKYIISFLRLILSLQHWIPFIYILFNYYVFIKKICTFVRTWQGFLYQDNDSVKSSALVHLSVCLGTINRAYERCVLWKFERVQQEKCLLSFGESGLHSGRELACYFTDCTTTTLRDRRCYHHLFSVKETEVWRGWITCPTGEAGIQVQAGWH